MSKHDAKVQQSSCQSGVKASVTRAVSDQERFYTHTDKTRFQNVSEQEKLNPTAASQHNHNKEDLETRTTSSPPSLQLKGQQKSSKDLQIKQIILFGSKNTSSRKSEEQSESARFTSTISIKLPTRRNKKDTAEEKTLQATTHFYRTLEAEKNTANQHHTELWDLQCGVSTGELLKDGQKATFDEAPLHQHGHNTPKHGQNTGIQHNIGLHEQTDHKDSLGHNSSHFIHELRTEVKKESGDHRENAPTTPQNHNNLDSVLKASTDSQLFTHQSEVLDQVLSLVCSENTPEVKANLINPTTAMLTSALASVLAPPLSGRLRRPKQGISEAETEVQDRGQYDHPSTLTQQGRRQQPFFPFQRQASEHMMANDSNMQVNAGTSYSADWQKENNSPNVTTTINQKRPITKSSSVSMTYNSRELHTTLDSRQVPTSAQSGYRVSKSGDENEPFKSLSSKPTTSSLLLSLRRSNLRNSTPEPTQTQTPITRSIRSLTLPSRIVLKTHSSDQSYTNEHQNPDTPVRTEEIPVGQFRFSPRIKSRVPLNTSMFSSKQETGISKGLEASVASAEVENEHFPHSTTKTSQLGALKSQQTSYLVFLREYSSTESIDPIKQSPGNTNNLQNSNITKRQIIQNTVISPKDSTGFQNQQSNFHMSKSQNTHNITASNSSGTNTFTDRLNFIPRKDSSVDGVSPTNVGQIYSRKYSSQSSMDLSGPLSPSRPLHNVRVPSIYSYLRESNSSLSSPSPSTPLSHIQNAEISPPKQDGGAKLHGDWKTLPSRFSFDFNPSVPKVQELQKSLSTNTSPAQSLPPDFGRGSAPRLSTSPYSSLISSRPALSSTLQGLSSPPVSETHSRSTSYNNPDLIKNDLSSLTSKYTSITRRPREDSASSHREQRTAVQAYASNLDNHRPAQPCLSQTTPDASFVMESRSANISSHPRQPNTGSNNFHNLEHDDSMALRLYKCNVYPKHRLSEKEKYLLPKDLSAQSETPLAHEKETTTGHMHERLQETQSPNSRKGLFASRVKKDGSFSSASLPEKEIGSFQFLKTKRHLPVFRTTSRIDQMLNRLKLTFGVKRSDSALDTVTKKNKTPTQQSSDTETFEIPKTDDKTCTGIKEEPCNSSLTIDKVSLGSLSPIKLSTSEHTLNVDGQNRSTSKIQYSECMWELPNSSLTTNKETFGSLPPLAIRDSENTSDIDWQNKSTKTNTEQNGSGCTWEAPSSSLTTDKTYLASFGSASPSSSKKSLDNKLYGDQQKMDSNEMENQSNGRSFSQHRLKAQSMNRSATLPHYRKSSFGPPSPFYLFDFDSEDIQNDSVFYSPVSKKTNSLCESDDISPLSSAKSSLQQNLVRSRLSSSCADLKYGLHGGRSFSVSGVVSSRTSGSRRISTSSTSDLSSLEDFAPKGNQTVDSLMSTSHSPSYDAKSVTGKQSQTEFKDDCLELDFADPTPPPSPTFSSSPRRISQALSTPSPIRTTPENLSPFQLPSRSYTNNLTVFEESGSDTTTDDEYYLGNGGEDDLETEL
ncbi:serine-rich adhesin for platelets [Danio aesculapii]|uniref:serine-rich adhesin for platelets n=1 Tax=Danio aesculapii TaxID=1142201 RepID=UPI0024BF2039|nr:serine-rich adhesin for platelets [Danio aesculapii]